MWNPFKSGAMAGAAAVLGLALAAGAAPASQAGAIVSTDRVFVPLTAQPVGNVEVTQEASGYLQARLDLAGVTPGSGHAVQLFPGRLVRRGQPATNRVVAFPDVTANGTGQIDTTVTSTAPASPTRLGELVIRLGPTGVTGADAGLAAEPTAEARVVVGSPHVVPVRPISDGTGRMRGSATITYDPSAQTLTIEVDAQGFTPYSSHAAHVHLGSCVSQGPVDYMIPDLVANRFGAMIHETRVLTGIPNFTTPAGGWYLNLHLGTSANILDSVGNPTIHLRPLLCGDINS